MNRKRFSASARESVLGSLVDNHITDGANLLNAVEFAESPQGLGISLYPVQRVLLKLIFGIPMDWDEKEVPVYDVFCENLLYTFKETEYIRYVSDKGRIMITDWREANPEGYNEIDCIVGRRGGKSQLVSAIMAYKLYRLLNLRSPQEYFGLVSGSPIDLTILAQDAEGSSRLYDKLKEDVNRCSFFAPFIKGSTSEMTFVSEADRFKRDITPSIKAMSFPCTTNAVRGPSSYVLALDEFAFYRNQVGVNSEEIYKAAAPATMQFKAGGVREGKRESMILIITSPNGRIGKYYQLYQSAMRMGNDSDILAFRCSTSEMNPRSDVAFLKKEFRENPDSFKAEYGGNFLEAAESYVKLATMNECVDLERPNKIQFEDAAIGRKYFWGLDLGMKHDATALAISHWEPNKTQTGATLVYDYIDRLMVGEGEYVGFKELPLDDLLKWLTHLNRYYPCFKGATDQHGGAMFVQLLESIEIHGLELVHLTSGINSQMYLTMKGLMEQRNIRFPNEEKFLNELKLVEASYVGKYQIRVEAPDEKDAHDDMCDAAALCSWVAQQWALNEGSREFRSILEGNSPVGPQIATGWDVNAPLSVLKSQERMMQMQMRSSIGVQNPFRRR